MSVNTWTLVIGIAAGVALSVLLRLALRRRRPPERRVEAPNSSFRSPFVERAERRDLWRRLADAPLHPVNRKEVDRLLRRMEQGGDQALHPTEQALLDRLVGSMQAIGWPGLSSSKRATS